MAHFSAYKIMDTSEKLTELFNTFRFGYSNEKWLESQPQNFSGYKVNDPDSSNIRGFKARYSKNGQ
jgi:hypothetical protein